MRKGVLIIILLAILLLVLTFGYSIYKNLNITGKQVFSDDDFIQDATSFKPGKNTAGGAEKIQLSPIDCSIKNISFSSLNLNIHDTVEIFVEGQDCGNGAVEIKLFEKDFFYDDGLAVIKSNFVKSNASLSWEIKKDDYYYLFEEIFEGERIEVYAETNISDVLTMSHLIYIFENEEVLMQPDASSINSKSIYLVLISVLFLLTIIVLIMVLRFIRLRQKFSVQA